MKRFPIFICVIVLVGFLSATSVSNFEPQSKTKSQKTDDKDKSKDKSKEKAKSDENTDKNAPKPLFQGNLGIKSSKQGKDTASLGFNGLGPDGQIEKAALNSPSTKVDSLDAAALIVYQPTPDEFKRFTSEGSLKPGPTPLTKPTDDKNKKGK